MSIINGLGSIARRVLFWGKQHAPELLIGSGIVIGAVGTAVACYESTKVKDIVDEAKSELDDIEEVSDKLEDPKRERAKVYVKTAGKIAKNYAPSIALSSCAVSCILYGAGILTKRNAALSMGLAAATNAFRDYRREVIDRYGEDVDQQLRYGVKTIEAKCKETDSDGKTKTVKKNREIMNPEKADSIVEDYIRLFDESNPYWDDDLDIVLYFIKSQQYIYNQKLIADGYVFLNDVLKSLGFPCTRIGQVTGWKYDIESPISDNFIDFRWKVVDIPVEVSDGSTIYKKAVVLDFNVDGGILDAVDWPDKM